MFEEKPPASNVSSPEPVNSTGYEFTPDENSEIAAVSCMFWLLGFILAVQVAKQVYSTVISLWHLFSEDTGGTWISIAERIAMLVFLGPLSYWFFSASNSFAAITKTSGRDIDHLMTGLRAIRSSYSWVVVLLLAGLLLGLVIALAQWFN